MSTLKDLNKHLFDQLDRLSYFTKLVEDLTQGQITLLPVQKQQLNNAIEEIA